LYKESQTKEDIMHKYGNATSKDKPQWNLFVLAWDKAVNDFQTLPKVIVLIISLKVASLGLNMVVACHVLLLDIWWKSTIEDQVIDRAH
jgi:SNF2 family DNA or RNA helicase